MVQKSQTTTWDGDKTLVKNGIDYQPQVLTAGFLNHEQYQVGRGMGMFQVLPQFLKHLKTQKNVSSRYNFGRSSPSSLAIYYNSWTWIKWILGELP